MMDTPRGNTAIVRGEGSLLDPVTPPGEFPSIQGWHIIHGGTTVPPDARLRLVWADESSSLSIAPDHGSPDAPTFVVRFDEVVQFTLSFASHEILISPLDGVVPDSTIQHLLVDQIWPRILAHCGELVLHAAGVSGPKGAMLFVGQSGHGKSTLAASLYQRGFELLGDDALVMSAADGEARCRAVYRSLRLFPDSIDTLFEQPVRRSDVADYTDKKNVHLPISGQDDGLHRVRAIFFINSDEPTTSARVERISPGAACMRLVEHSFWLDPTDMALTARKLAQASTLANDVPAYTLAYPRDYAKLGELHAAVFSVVD